MSKLYNAKSAFAQVKESTNASDYIKNKKTRYSFCTRNECYPNKKTKSYSQFYARQTADNLTSYSCINYNKSQLYKNLYTELDLSDLSLNTPIISDLDGNSFPVTIDVTVQPYLKYNIDPSGNLFGNDVCGINNFLKYVVPN